MDHSTRRFIGVTRQFLAVVRKLKKELRKSLTDLNSALHKQTEAVRKSNETRDNEQRRSPEIIARVNLPESIEVHQSEDDTRKERSYKGRTLLVSTLTLIAIVVYAVLVYLQYREMIFATGAAQQAVVEARRNRLQADKAFTATVEQFHLDQRAWLGVIDTTPTANPTTQGKGFASKVVNTGKTPALITEARYTAGFFHGPLAELPTNPPYDASDVHQLHTAVVPGGIFPIGIFPPYVSGQANDAMLRKTTWNYYGVISYSDVFGQPHFTRFCYHYIWSPLTDPRWQLAQCARYNETDDQQKH